MRVTLLETAPRTLPGSMPAYARMVEAALHLPAASPPDVHRMSLHHPKAGVSMWHHHLWRLRHARRLLDQTPDGIFHLLDGSMAGLLPRRVWPRLHITVHDLIPLRMACGELPGPRPSAPARLLLRRTLAALRVARRLGAVSQATARDLERWTGRTAHALLPLALRPLPSPDPVPPAEAPLLLHVGSGAPYKNREGVLEVFARLRPLLPQASLVFAGAPPAPSLRARAEALGGVRFEINPDDKTLATLYHQATLLLFPSHYEGFGMPVLEAMAAGCPVVCSHAGALRELTGEAALSAPPDDVEGLARHAHALATSPDLQRDLRRRGRQRAQAFSLPRLQDQLLPFYADSCPVSDVSGIVR